MKKPPKYTYLISYVVMWDDGRYTHAHDYMDAAKDLTEIEAWELQAMLDEKAEGWAENEETPHITPIFIQKLKYRAPSEGKDGSVSLPLSILGDKK